MFRRSLLLGVLLLPAGCAAADRESYSVAFSRKAHAYGDISYVPPPTDSEILEEYLRLPDRTGRNAFRPFAHCTLHDSDHIPESMLAVVAAPVEYPLVLAISTTSDVFQGTFGEVARFLGLVGPGTGKELPYRNEDANR
jgi:hypothetical protein